MEQLTRGVKERGSTVEGAGSGAAGLAGRSMPESLAAEAAVLGSMIVDPGVHQSGR